MKFFWFFLDTLRTLFVLLVVASPRGDAGGLRWWGSKRNPTLVVSDHAIVWLFRRECPVLGCRPGQGGWCRIVPPLVFWTVS